MVSVFYFLIIVQHHWWIPQHNECPSTVKVPGSKFRILIRNFGPLGRPYDQFVSQSAVTALTLLIPLILHFWTLILPDLKSKVLASAFFLTYPLVPLRNTSMHWTLLWECLGQNPWTPGGKILFWGWALRFSILFLIFDFWVFKFQFFDFRYFHFQFSDFHFIDF